MLTTIYSDLTIDDALAFQDAFVGALAAGDEDQVTGYKLGLTGPTRPFGAPEAIWGRLLGSMLVPEGQVIYRNDFVSPGIEVEVAFIFGEDVSYPATQDALRRSVAGVAPAVELPDAFFASMDKLSWLDLVAGNVGARYFIVGEHRPLGQLDVDALQTVARRDGKIIGETPASATMGGQWNALEFLVEKLNERDLRIRAGDIVITGALGGMLPAEVGQYEIDYGELGRIEFEVRDR